jgi:death-on-curing protein
MSPFQTFNNEDLFPTIRSKAARLGYGIIKNHPFVDGNKRIGVHLMLLFLYFNNVEPDYTQEELSTIILNTASGEDGCNELLEWIIRHG